ncbi:MAG: hypothetical protein AAB649_02675, partial [Patescibacteria group bacterium]
ANEIRQYSDTDYEYRDKILDNVKNASDEELLGASLSYAKTEGEAHGGAMEELQNRNKNKAGEENGKFKNMKRMIERETGKITSVSEGDGNMIMANNMRKSTLLGRASDKEVMLDAGQISQIIRVLKQIKENKGAYGNDVAQEAGKELEYYNGNKDAEGFSIHKSLALGGILGKLTGAQKQSLIGGTGLSSSYALEQLAMSGGTTAFLRDHVSQGNIAEVMQESSTSGQKMLESIGRMWQDHSQAIASPHQRAVRAVSGYMTNEDVVNDQLRPMNMQLPNEPADQIFNISDRTDIDEAVKTQLTDFIQAPAPKAFDQKYGTSADLKAIGAAIQKLEGEMHHKIKGINPTIQAEIINQKPTDISKVEAI